VFVTKLLHPFDDTPRFSSTPESITTVRINWEAWKTIYTDPVEEGLERRQIDKLAADDAWQLNKRQIDDYLTWYQRAGLKENDGEWR